MKLTLHNAMDLMRRPGARMIQTNGRSRVEYCARPPCGIAGDFAIVGLARRFAH
jgi:hypothetical protein